MGSSGLQGLWKGSPRARVGDFVWRITKVSRTNTSTRELWSTSATHFVNFMDMMTSNPSYSPTNFMQPDSSTPQCLTFTAHDYDHDDDNDHDHDHDHGNDNNNKQNNININNILSSSNKYAASPTSRRTRNPSQCHRCTQCSRVYARSDHLVRHLRSHSEHRLYTCSVCGKSFARKDLLRRHSILHSRSFDAATDGHKNSPVFVRRTTKACGPCAVAKVKCHDQKPCRRCQQRGLYCDIPGSPNAAQSLQSVHAATRTTDHQDFISFPSVMPVTDSLSCIQDEWAAADGTSPSLLNPFYSQMALQSNTSQIDEQLDVILQAYNVPAFFDAQMYTANHSSEQVPILAQADDFSSGARFGTELTRSSIDRTFARSPQYNYLTFRNSLWHSIPAMPAPHFDGAYSPSTHDSCMIECLSTNVSSSWQHSFDQQTRDSLMIMLSQDGTDPLLCGEMGFVSIELMNILSRRFLAFQDRKIDSWIHSATVKPQTTIIELAGMIVAAGTLGTSIQSLRNWGYQLHKHLQPMILRKLEKGYKPRLQLLQSFLIGLELDLWHGEEHSLHQAGGLSNVIQTYLRLELRNKAWPNSSAPPSASEDDAELEDQWSHWITAESYKRLTTRFCVYDNQRSMTLNIRPSTAFTEYRLPAPHPSSLWLAKSASEWRDTYLECPSAGRTPRVMELLAQMPAVRTETGFCDRLHSKKLAFHILGGMIVDHHLLAGGFRSRGDITGDVGDSKCDGTDSEDGGESNGGRWYDAAPEPASIRTRRSELEASISNFELQLAFVDIDLLRPHSGIAYINNLPVAYLFMSLAVSVEDIEILAGKEGDGEARRMRRRMRCWTDSRASREAVWCAGQVLRFFRTLRKVTSFHVVLAYQAGLVLYAFAELLGRAENNETARWATRNGKGRVREPSLGWSHLCLNSSSSPAPSGNVQAFIKDGALEPALQGVSNETMPVSFRDAREVVRVVNEIIIDRTCTCEGLSLRLVQGLIGLLGELTVAAYMPPSNF